jgi:hypothetical protein
VVLDAGERFGVDRGELRADRGVRFFSSTVSRHQAEKLFLVLKLAINGRFKRWPVLDTLRIVDHSIRLCITDGRLLRIVYGQSRALRPMPSTPRYIQSGAIVQVFAA